MTLAGLKVSDLWLACLVGVLLGGWGRRRCRLLLSVQLVKGALHLADSRADHAGQQAGLLICLQFALLLLFACQPLGEGFDLQAKAAGWQSVSTCGVSSQSADGQACCVAQ